ncbi:diguanylate cyclase [Marinospirillum sp. MEB164]|uniref:diguanylate cyclase n=1 Tax=Marinospirillum alkalitolerans TaxID=3123374 RepID=A0ABW8PV88_9GAMM
MNIFSLLNLTSGLLLLGLSGLAWRYRAFPAGKTFIALMLCAATYSVGLGLEALSHNLDQAWWWSRVQYLGIPWISPLILLLVLQFCGYALNTPAARVGLSLMFSFSALVMLAHWTSPGHDWYYLNIQLAHWHKIGIVQFTPGGLYQVFSVYYLGASFFSLLILALRSMEVKGVLRRQTLIVLLGISIPLAFNLSYLFHWTPEQLDITPLAFALGTLPLAYGLFVKRLLDLQPIAMRRVFRSMPIGCLVTDQRGLLLDYNPAARQIFPLLTEQLIGEPLAEHLPAELELVNKLQQGKRLDRLDQPWTLDGQHFYRAEITTLYDATGPVGRLVMIHNVTEHYWAEKALRQLAERDSLTHLLNRRSFDEQFTLLSHSSECYRQPLALILLDIDHFKQLNDTQGHQQGDQALIAVAQCLNELQRPQDIVARYGGEEFVLLLPETCLDEALEQAEHIRAQIEATTPVTASLGVASCTSMQVCNQQQLLQLADQALYRAKQAGRNQVQAQASIAS